MALQMCETLGKKETLFYIYKCQVKKIILHLHPFLQINQRSWVFPILVSKLSSMFLHNFHPLGYITLQSNNLKHKQSRYSNLFFFLMQFLDMNEDTNADIENFK